MPWANPQHRAERPDVSPTIQAVLEARLTPGFVFPACRPSKMFTFHLNKRVQGLFHAGCEPTLAGIEEKVPDMRKTAVFLLCLMAVPGLAHAAAECPSTTVPQAAPLR